MRASSAASRKATLSDTCARTWATGARITHEVERELLRLAERDEFASLADYLSKEGAVAIAEGKWPRLTKNPPDALKDEFTRLLELKRATG